MRLVTLYLCDLCIAGVGRICWTPGCGLFLSQGAGHFPGNGHRGGFLCADDDLYRCCGEPDCKRKTPIALYLAPFSGQVFAATEYRVVKDHGDGRATFAATRRHDVTDSMRRFIRDNPDWVRDVLFGVRDGA